MLTSERSERRARRRWRAAAGAEARQVSTGGGTRDISRKKKSAGNDLYQVVSRVRTYPRQCAL